MKYENKHVLFYDPDLLSWLTLGKSSGGHTIDTTALNKYVKTRWEGISAWQ